MPKDLNDFIKEERKLYFDDTVYYGLYAQLRYDYLMKTSARTYRAPKDKFRWVYIRHIFALLFHLPMVLFRRKSYRNLVFLTGRRDSQGRDLYMEEYLDKNTLRINYSPSMQKAHIYLFPIKLILMSISLFRVNRNLSLPRILLNRRKESEYFIWLYFWDIIFTYFKNINRVHFTSMNFFHPLIAMARKHNVRTNEVAHAIVSPYHYSYNYGFEDQRHLFPDVYIENTKSFGASGSFIRWLDFRTVRKQRVQRTNNKYNSVLIIPGPFETDEDVIRLQREYINDDVKVVVHPLDPLDKYQGTTLRLNDVNLEGHYLVLGWSSNLLIELYYLGNKVYSLDENFINIARSRGEKINSFVYG